MSNVPAHASLAVNALDGRLNSLRTVAGMEECSNCEVGVGPLGVWTTARTQYINKPTNDRA